MEKNKNKILHMLYQPYKWLVYIPIFILSTCFFVFIGIFVSIFLDDKAANRTTGVWWARFNSYLIPMFVKVSGREYIKKDQSYVVISNHQSLYDIFVLYGWLGIDIKWVMKKELQNIPVFGFAGKIGGNIYIDRSDPKAAYESLQEAKKKITGGTSIIILPEGTRSNTGELREFKKGAFVTAIDLEIPILPVTISGTRNILPARSFDQYPGKASMIIHEPMDVKKYSKKNVEKFIRDAKNIISSGIDLN